MIISDRNVKSTAIGMSSYGQVGDRSWEKFKQLREVMTRITYLDSEITMDCNEVEMKRAISEPVAKLFSKSGALTRG